MPFVSAHPEYLPRSNSYCCCTSFCPTPPPATPVAYSSSLDRWIVFRFALLRRAASLQKTPETSIWLRGPVYFLLPPLSTGYNWLLYGILQGIRRKSPFIR